MVVIGMVGVGNCAPFLEAFGDLINGVPKIKETLASDILKGAVIAVAGKNQLTAPLLKGIEQTADGVCVLSQIPANVLLNGKVTGIRKDPSLDDLMVNRKYPQYPDYSHPNYAVPNYGAQPLDYQWPNYYNQYPPVPQHQYPSYGNGYY